VQQHWSQWEAQGLYLFFLPAYCAEMNRIELESHQLKTHELAGQMFEDELDLDRKLNIKIQLVLFAIAFGKGSDRRYSKQGISSPAGRTSLSSRLVAIASSLVIQHGSPAFNSLTHCVIWAFFSDES
jgi:hypothetical protein